jgi:hypothetical protein
MSDSRGAELLAIIKAQNEQIERVEQENRLLRQKIDLLIRKIFSSSSEPNGVR